MYGFRCVSVRPPYLTPRFSSQSCYDVVGLPHSATCELNGSLSPKLRESLWKEHNIFFATPQTIAKDLETSKVPVGR